MNFADHFSAAAPAYRRARPRYPAALFAAICEHVTGRELAWDCGTGNGQAALGLATRFAQVVATDASESQIVNAFPIDNVRYLVAPAERSPLADGSVDLVTVAEALHWFDLPAFHAELRRVLKVGGVFAAWSYGDATIAPDIDPIVAAFRERAVADYWPPQAHNADVARIPQPGDFQAIPLPATAMVEQWTADHFIGYVQSWSGTQRLMNADPAAVHRFTDAVGAAWGTVPRAVRWPLSVQVGRLQ